MPGTVITFYSYKGGVGRSFALVNTATILASWGYRVLCVDWDLEAPGLDAYFRPFLSGPPASGLADVFTEFGEGRTADPGPHVVRLDMEVRGRIDFLPAGGGDDYVRKAQRLDWATLYRDRDLGAELEKWRQRWAEDYHFVLIDSRTGITDIGGICTAQMPDILVAMFTANEQSLSGVREVARRAVKARDKLPYDRAGLLVLPVPSRFEGRDEYDQAAKWQRRFAEELAPQFDSWISRRTSAGMILNHVTIPYVAYWSFGEEIAALRELTPSPHEICYSLQTIAALLAHRLDRTDLLAEGRDGFVSAAARGGQREDEGGYQFDAFISFDPRHEEGARYAQACRAELRGRNWRVFLAPAGAGARLRGGGEATEALARSTSLIAIVADRILLEQQHDIEVFLRQSLDEESERTLIPLLLSGASTTGLPPAARQLPAIRPGSHDEPADVAAELALTLAYRAAIQAYHRLLSKGQINERLPVLDALLGVAEQAGNTDGGEMAADALKAAVVVAGLVSRNVAKDSGSLKREAAARERLAIILADRGRQEDALDHARVGLVVRRQLAARHPGNPAEMTELAAALRTVGGLQNDTGRPDLARLSLTEALEVLPRASGPATAMERGRVLNVLALLDIAEGDFDGALRALRERLELLGRFSHRNLRDQLGHRAVADANVQIAVLFVVTGQPENAIEFFNEAIARYRSVLSMDGRDADALRGISGAAQRLGDLLLDLDPQGAVRHYDQAVPPLSLLLEMDPGDDRARFDLASVLSRIGSLAGNPELAIVDYERALSVLASPPDSDRTVTRLRADILFRLGEREMARGHAAAGDRHLRQALAIGQRLLLADPADPDAHEIAYRVNSQLARFAFQGGDLEEARRRIQAALESSKRIAWGDSARRRAVALLAEIDQASAK